MQAPIAIELRDRAGPGRPACLGVRLQIIDKVEMNVCANRAGPVPVLSARLQMYLETTHQTAVRFLPT